MVELNPVHNGETADFKSNAMSIAGAFRAASDDDTRNVMNAMSSKARSSLGTLKFYIVPASWFLKAWPLLMARSPEGIKESFREHIGSIQNAELLDDVEHAVSSSDEENNIKSSDGSNNDGNSSRESDAERQKRRFERLHRKMAMSRQQWTMRKGLSHKRDFFFLGSNAWTLVKEKFGFDGYELGRECVFTENSQNVVAIKLHPGEVEDNKSDLICIPLSGRFAYEKTIAKSGTDTGASSDIVSEEDEEGADMFPWNRDLCETENAASNDGPILLLPASTTESATNQSSPSAVAKCFNPSADDMDVDSGAADGAEKVTSASPVVGVTPATTTSRKRYASGLGNLGNTCFMNSTIQCLAHTEPLRRYFLSGDYENELNKENPLGTGGDLATQFAYLLSEMWGVPAKRRNVLGASEYNYTSSASSAVYPRNFKFTLGKHAEQFMGYDQHDSQELATYLLDALHEDTNRVTKKPYVEKPEQGEDEPDEVAAAKAWQLHLQRDDSKVLENFMGQVKSRVQCCEEGCKRVSTTFDPFMYLSVPIPGATDRTMKVSFVPLDPGKRTMNMKVTVGKTADINTLLGKMNEQLVKLGIRKEPVPLCDLAPVDIWSHEVYSWYTNDSEVDRIRDTDTTYIFELLPLSEVQEASKPAENGTEDDIPQTSMLESRSKNRSKRYKLDLATITKLNRDDEWSNVLENYVHQPNLLYTFLNVNRGTIDERIKFHHRLENFIDQLHKETTEEESSGLKRSREESEEVENNADEMVFPEGETIQGVVDRTDASQTFKNVKNKHDIAILEFCSGKFRQFILKMIKDKQCKYKDGVIIQVVMRRPSGTASFASKVNTFAVPLVLRIPSNMTVYGLREELATRLSRTLRFRHPPVSTEENVNSGESSAEITDREDVTMQSQDSQPFGSPSLLLMRQVPLSYEKKDSYGYKSSISGNKQLGMLERSGSHSTERQASLASPSDDAEQELVCEVVGPNGAVYIDWPSDMSERCFDATEYEASDDVEVPDDGAVGSRTRLASKATSVADCIDKYCQMEQLEETEMWYCNRCKKHVRAWKQFHIYRSPPILIVHLKRFHYSPSTHRRDKISAMIDFPLEGLDLTDVVSHWGEGEKPIYDCYAVSNHYGGLGGGHYTAYILSDDGTWVYYDDNRVTLNVDASEVRSEAAYVLYYRRRDVPVGEDYCISEGQAPALVSDQPETGPESGEVSSNNTAQAGDDDMVVEDTDGRSAGSSRTCPSPMGSTDGGDDLYEDDNERSENKVASSDDGGGGIFPLQ